MTFMFYRDFLWRSSKNEAMPTPSAFAMCQSVITVGLRLGQRHPSGELRLRNLRRKP